MAPAGTAATVSTGSAAVSMYGIIMPVAAALYAATEPARVYAAESSVILRQGDERDRQHD